MRTAFQAEGIVEIEIAVVRVVDDLRSVKKDLNEIAQANTSLASSLFQGRSRITSEGLNMLDEHGKPVVRNAMGGARNDLIKVQVF
jgi:hypothetical protein